MEEDGTQQENTESSGPSKKERAQIRRDEKERAKESARRMRKIKRHAMWTVIVVMVVGGTYLAVRAAEEAEENRPGTVYQIVGRDHINVGDEHAGYNSNPPTSGSHAQPLNWGMYAMEQPDENLVHNLEHGGIWLSYKDISPEELSVLEQIARDNPQSVVLTPRNANDSPIAVASWGRLLKLDAVDEALIREYIDKNKNKSPEPLAR